MCRGGRRRSVLKECGSPPTIGLTGVAPTGIQELFSGMEGGSVGLRIVRVLEPMPVPEVERLSPHSWGYPRCFGALCIRKDSSKDRQLTMTIHLLHGHHSIPQGVKPTYLNDHGHIVINPMLWDDDFDEAMKMAQAEFDKYQPQVVMGSSRGGAVAMRNDAWGSSSADCTRRHPAG